MSNLMAVALGVLALCGVALLFLLAGDVLGLWLIVVYRMPL